MIQSARQSVPSHRSNRAAIRPRASEAAVERAAGACCEELEHRLLLTAFTRTSPTAGGALPAGVTEVGGVVLDLIGQNNVRVVSQLAASSLFQGFSNDGTPIAYRGNPVTIGIQTGYTPAVVNALGGGLKEVALRMTLFDGDTGPGEFDDNQNTLRLNDIDLGNFSDVVTNRTSNDGLTFISANPAGGFRNDVLDTGFFYSNNATFLANFFTTLSTGQITVKLFDVDPTDNFFDFKQGVDGGLIDIGLPPNISPVIDQITGGPGDEGSLIDVTVTAHDPDGPQNALTYFFDFDNNGSYEVSNTTGIASHTFADNGSYTVPVRVTDASSGTNSSKVIVVNNVAPANVTVNLSNVGNNVSAGGTFTDPGILDTHTVSVNWGDGSPNTVLNLGANVLSYNAGPHTYAAGTSQAHVTVTVTDKDGGSGMGENTLDFNRPPTVGVLPMVTANEDDPDTLLSLNSYFSDPDGDVLAYNVQSITGAPGLFTAVVTAPDTLTIHYNANANGTGFVTIHAQDPAGLSVEGTFKVVVRPVNDKPIADNTGAVLDDEDDSVGVTLSGSDIETAAGALKFTITSLPTLGTLSYAGAPVVLGQMIVGSPVGLTYTNGTAVDDDAVDSFTYTVTDNGDPAGSLLNKLTSDPATATIFIDTLGERTFTYNHITRVVRVGGSRDIDNIQAKLDKGRLKIVYNGKDAFSIPADEVSEFRIYARGSNDTVTVGAGLPPVFVNAGTGDDKVSIESNDGVVLGGEGNDQMQGKGANGALMIGGAGKDNMTGGSGRNVMVGGAASPLLSYPDLRDIAAGWATSGPAFATSPAGVAFRAGVVDTESDVLKGGNAADWLIANSSPIDQATADPKQGDLLSLV
jgi:hypothetical protein